MSQPRPGVVSDPHGASAQPAPPASSSALRFLPLEPPPPPALPPAQQPARSRKRPLDATAHDATAHDAAALVVRIAPPPPLPPSSTLKFVLPGPKRARREPPASPTSVGDVSDSTAAPAPTPAAVTSAAATATASPASAQMQSMLRGLQHVAGCGAAGCANPLCVSTRNFVAKVQAHQAAAVAKPSHDGARCGACQLWAGIVRAHAPGCAAVGCGVPGCARLKQAAGRAV